MCREVELSGDGKGNSLFSEVEDRRQKVEWQLRMTNERYSTIGVIEENSRDKQGFITKYLLRDLKRKRHVVIIE